MRCLSVVIPTTGHAKSLNSLIDSIKKDHGFDRLEIHIVCNPSSTKLSALIESTHNQQIFVHQLEVVGANRARQYGLEQARYDLVLFLDDDCLIETPQQIQSLYHELELDRQLFAVGGGYNYSQQRLNFAAKGYADNQMNWLQQGIYDFENKYSAYLIGGFFILRKSVCFENGISFDVNMKFGGTEKEFFLQAYKKKLRMRFIPVFVTHIYQNNYFSYFKKIFKQGVGHRYIQEKGLEYKPKYLLNNQYKSTLLMDMVFWSGHFMHKQEYFKMLQFLFKIIINSLNEKKYIILNRLKKSL